MNTTFTKKICFLHNEPKVEIRLHDDYFNNIYSDVQLHTHKRAQICLRLLDGRDVFMFGGLVVESALLQPPYRQKDRFCEYYANVCIGIPVRYRRLFSYYLEVGTRTNGIKIRCSVYKYKYNIIFIYLFYYKPSSKCWQVYICTDTDDKNRTKGSTEYNH